MYMNAHMNHAPLGAKGIYIMDAEREPDIFEIKSTEDAYSGELGHGPQSVVFKNLDYPLYDLSLVHFF